VNGIVVGAALVPLLVIDGRTVRVDEVSSTTVCLIFNHHTVRQRCEAMRADKRFKRPDVEQARLEIALAK
jgi:hypothetical protein